MRFHVHPPRTSGPISSKVVMGTVLAVAATFGWLLSLAAERNGLPAGLQGFIRSNAAMWMLSCGAGLITGLTLLWRAGHARTEWEPSRAGRRFHTIVVYTREDCPLCEDAVEVLSQYRNWLPLPNEVLIDDDPELMQLYKNVVPVVTIDGKVRFRGSISEILLRRLIEATTPIALLRNR